MSNSVLWRDTKVWDSLLSNSVLRRDTKVWDSLLSNSVLWRDTKVWDSLLSNSVLRRDTKVWDSLLSNSVLWRDTKVWDSLLSNSSESWNSSNKWKLQQQKKTWLTSRMTSTRPAGEKKNKTLKRTWRLRRTKVEGERPVRHSLLKGWTINLKTQF